MINNVIKHYLLSIMLAFEKQAHRKKLERELKNEQKTKRPT